VAELVDRIGHGGPFGREPDQSSACRIYFEYFAGQRDPRSAIAIGEIDAGVGLELRAGTH
jgi:hypothetical protein